MLGLLGLRIFEATGSNIDDLGEEHGHRVLRVRGKGDKVVLVPLPPAVGRALERAIEDRTTGPILLTSRGIRMDRHCATRRLRRLTEAAGVKLPRMHPHMLRHTLVTTMLDAGVDLRDVQIAARHADPRTTMRYDRARKNLDRWQRPLARICLLARACLPPGRTGVIAVSGTQSVDEHTKRWLHPARSRKDGERGRAGPDVIGVAELGANPAPPAAGPRGRLMHPLRCGSA